MTTPKPECGCKIIKTGPTTGDRNIDYCPLHAAAGELLEACREYLDTHTISAYKRIEIAAAKASGKES